VLIPADRETAIDRFCAGFHLARRIASALARDNSERRSA
jgi:hypothetical protein